MFAEKHLIEVLENRNVAAWRLKLGRWIESHQVQVGITVVILINALILGLETSKDIMAAHGTLLQAADKICLSIFVLELACKMISFRSLFWRSGWNWFDFIVVGIALLPGTGVWAVVRSLRVLRVLRLFTVVPQLRKVVAAFLHAIPGLSGVIAIMSIFFFTAGVLATKLFGEEFPAWFGTLGRSLYSLFQIMTLESWSMGIVRPVMEVFPFAWAFFIPFIVIATFTILNLFIGIIVSTMQELSALPETTLPRPDLINALTQIEVDIQALRKQIEADSKLHPRQHR
jgi:voltage-gated sodium channel